MPISVVCPSCKARFNVSDKFAGKQGPCPKCKAKITIPKLEEQVTIHAPEEYASGGKDAKGRPVSKPIARVETKFKPKIAAAMAGGALVVFFVAYLLGFDRWQILLTDDENWLEGILRVVGLMLISPPIVAGAYAFLSDPELEPFKGAELWKRSALCALGYIAIWIGCWYVPGDILATVTIWFFILPPVLVVGAGISFACLDLDIQNSFFHYACFLLITIGVAFAAGLDHHWLKAIQP